ncbi:hypothetical protein [Tsukamurella tyrosinosolvens]|uniref:Gp37-like protein n=1 Tax=Tsukamurella tyrosinosolvens TaxID=57704 RepID=UPI0034619F86
MLDFDFDLIHEATEQARRKRQELAGAPPFIRLWQNGPGEDEGLILVGIVRDSIKGQFQTLKNKPGSGTLLLRADHWMSQKVIKLPTRARYGEKQNLVVTVETMGGVNRWSGLMHHWKVTKDKEGIYLLEITFIDDLQYLDFLLGPPNPALPIPIFQFPRVLPLFGPSKFVISLLMLMNVARVESGIWQLPDDPFSLTSWVSGFDISTWQCYVKCDGFFTDSSLWTILATRMNKISSVIADALEDSQQVLKYRRILTADGETPADYGLSYVSHCNNGALVLEVADESGFYEADGTPTGGGIAGGFWRSITTFLDGFVETEETFIDDDETIYPNQYYEAGWFTSLPFWSSWTVPKSPWVVVRDSPWSAIETAELTHAPASAVKAIVGGQNPYVDQAIELAIQATGDMLGYFLLGGFSSAGDIAATVIMPFLRGTVFAWLEWKNFGRTQSLGWAHLWEVYQDGAENNAWSLSAIAALRSGFLSTKAQTSHQFKVIGGTGAFYPGLSASIGQRIGSTLEYVYDYIFISQMEEMTLAWDITSSTDHEWSIAVGNNKAAEPISLRQTRLVMKALDTISAIGCKMIS